MRNTNQKVSYLPVLLLGLVLSGCATSPPSQTDNICEIFREKSGWYNNALDAEKRWGMPIALQMAILRQESRFTADAQPPKDYLLGFIPWGRVSSAYGYTQALDATWDWYREQTGNSWAGRTNFADAVDFVAWYGDMSKTLAGISPTDGYNQYLAYHEGHTGFKKGSYKSKPKLLKIARSVEGNSNKFEKQLTVCRDEFEAGFWSWILQLLFTA